MVLQLDAQFHLCLFLYIMFNKNILIAILNVKKNATHNLSFGVTNLAHFFYKMYL